MQRLNSLFAPSGRELPVIKRGRLKRFGVFLARELISLGERAPSRVFLRALAEKQGTFAEIKLPLVPA